MKEITQSEAQSALDSISDGFTKFSVQGKPDRLCNNLFVYPVRVWDGEYVDWEDVLFRRVEGKVLAYAAL